MITIKEQESILKQIDRNKEKYDAQEHYCKKMGLEIFVYSNGECPNRKCRKNIFDGYTLQECSTKLITGCPFCNESFLE